MVTFFPKPLNRQVAAISDSLKRTQKGLGIEASGDTHDAIGSGQFVYVRDHSSLAEGLYKSKAAIAQDGALSTSNLTADDSGGLNDLQSQVTALNSKIANRCVMQNGSVSWTGDASGWSYAQVTFPISYSKLPLVSVMPSTAQANPTEPPAIHSVTNTGFEFGYYKKTGTVNFEWQAIGNVD